MDALSVVRIPPIRRDPGDGRRKLVSLTGPTLRQLDQGLGGGGWNRSYAGMTITVVDFVSGRSGFRSCLLGRSAQVCRSITYVMDIGKLESARKTSRRARPKQGSYKLALIWARWLRAFAGNLPIAASSDVAPPADLSERMPLSPDWDRRGRARPPTSGPASRPSAPTP